MRTEAAPPGRHEQQPGLREIGPVRQDSARGLRRWFQDDYFDLYVWQDHRGTPIAFQLCYDRGACEGAISWSAVAGFAHARVETGDVPYRHRGTPLLREAGLPPYFRIYNRFLEAADRFEPRLRAMVLDRLRDYRIELFGAPRKPRRKRR
jgi:hypothetical protein